MPAIYNPRGIPEELRNQKRWALSAPGLRTGWGHDYPEKGPMIPYYGVDETRCIPLMSTNPITWQTFNTVDAWQDIVGGYPGLFVDGDLVGIDFDMYKTNDPVLLKFIQDLIASCPGYVETSPSGNGVRALVRGKLPRGRKTAAIEIYTEGRFLRMTGAEPRGVLRPADDHQQAWIDCIYNYMPHMPDFEDGDEFDASLVTDLTVAELRERYEEIIAELPPHEKFNIERIDNGEGIEDASKEALTVAIALFRVERDPAVVFNIMLAIGGLIDHYSAKFKGNWVQQMARKFRRDWGINGPRVAKQANAQAQAIDLVKPQIDMLVEASKNKIVVQREEALKSNAVPDEQPVHRDYPALAPLPNTWLYNHFANALRSNLSKQDENWITMTATFFTGMLVSSVYRISGDSCAPQFVVPANSGDGKAIPAKFWASIEQRPDPLNPIQPFDIRSSVTSGEAIRDNLSDTSHLILMYDEATEFMLGLSDDQGPLKSLKIYLPNAIDGREIFKGARAKSTKDIEAQQVRHPLLSMYLPIQHAFVGQALTSESLASGMIGRLTFFPIPPRPREKAPPFLGAKMAPIELATVVKNVMNEFRKNVRFDVDTTTIASTDEWAKRVVDELPYIKALDPIYNRAGQMALKFATTRLGSRELEFIGQRPLSTTLTEDDIAYGFSVVRQSIEYMRYILNVADSTALGGESQKQRVIYKAVQKAVNEKVKKGEAHIIPSRVMQYCGSGHGRRGKPIGQGAIIVRQDVVHILMELCSHGVLAARDGKGTSFEIKAGLMTYLNRMIEDTQGQD